MIDSFPPGDGFNLFSSYIKHRITIKDKAKIFQAAGINETVQKLTKYKHLRKDPRYVPKTDRTID